MISNQPSPDRVATGERLFFSGHETFVFRHAWLKKAVDAARIHRSTQYTTRYMQRLVHDAARRAGIDRHVTPYRLRASVATILLDAGTPLDQVQKFLRHKRITTTQTYAETSLHGMGANYIPALGGKQW